MNFCLKNQKVLVTGGAGFIGSHLVQALVKYGACVTVLDNLSTGSLDNLNAISDQIEFIHGDIRNVQDCLKACKNQTTVFHLAAEISVQASQENPSVCYETNVIGTQHMLHAAQINSAKRFIFSSSAAVYGTQDEPCHEEMTCKPTSAYGHSKLLGELLCKDYWQQYGLPTVCLRYFNVHGERQSPHGSYAAVVAAFRHAMQTNSPITIYGNGSQSRDFIHVTQVAQANIQASLQNEKLVAGQVFNVATGTSITLLQLIDQLKPEFPNYSIPLNFQPARQGDIQHSQALCTKASRLDLNTQK